MRTTRDAPAQNRLETNVRRLVGGNWFPSATGPMFDVRNPVDGAALASVPDSGADAALAAVGAAEQALATWRGTAPRERTVVLMRCFELMHEHHEDLARLISLENGKALSDSRGEVTYAAEFFRWYAEEAVRIEGRTLVSPSGDNTIEVHYEPIGVALLVTPWNFPAAMATRKLAPALAAGCTAVLKPAGLTPLTAYAIADLMRRAGVPDGAINVVTTQSTDRVVGAMLADARIRKLSFTGSTSVGKLLLHKAADAVVNCSMELGGNAPFIVFEDADIHAALDGLMVAKMRNGGQACTAANRVYVHRSIALEFAELLAKRMGALRMGDPLEERTECGPLINVDAADKVEALVDHALAHGARALTGGRRDDPASAFYPPTVLVDLDPESLLLSEEIFGPVAPVLAFDDEAEVVAAANNTNYGLVAYVYTADLRRGKRIAARLESGMVALNRGMVSDAAAPFGGVKESGLGREGGHDGILQFLEAKYLAVSSG
jgi:succinate-semialdehyde dehydrogenase / glutarate-semialdehyde dehydrogenase